MNTDPKGANRLKLTLPLILADDLDNRVLRLAEDLEDLLALVDDLSFRHRKERRLRHIQSHLKVAAGRLRRVKPYARQLWNEANAADQGGRSHG